MPNERDIRNASQLTDRWLLRRQRKHVKFIEKSIGELQKSILNSISTLRTNKDGMVEGIRVNLKQSQKIHRDIEKSFQGKYSTKMRSVINDFKNINSLVKRSYQYLDEAVTFTGVEETALTVLRDGMYQDYIQIGTRAKNKIVQEVYNNVLANGEFSTLVGIIEQQLLGSALTGVTGKPLVQYARLYANDMIMNYHNEVNLMKAEDAGLNHFLYVGDIIATTRDFCKRRVGKIYTRNQIQSWTYRWGGKSGPALTHRGGYNCRHHWQATDPKWHKGKKRVNVADWNLEQRAGG